MDANNPLTNIGLGHPRSQLRANREVNLVGSSYTRRETDEKFKEMNYILIGVVVILLIMVATLIIDSFHINSVTYKEYSEKLDITNDLKNINKELQLQNKTNQEKIIEQQKIILQLLNR